MKFKSELNRPEKGKYAQKKFSKTMKKYEDLINEKTGKMETTVTEIIPFDDMIQEHKDSVTLDSILERYKVDLSKEVIKEISDDIIDMTIMPQDAIEAYAMINEAKLNFEKTTAEFKREFNNNFGEYLAGFKNGKTMSILSKHNIHTKNKQQTPTQQVQQAPIQQVQQQVQQAPIQQVQQQVQQNIQNTIMGGNGNV